MPEPLIHFIVPFFILIMLGLNLKRAASISLLAVFPDLDIIFHVHRSISHSVVFILVIFIPIILILISLRKKLKDTKFSNLYIDAILASLVVLSHPIMDLFTWYTPLLWPLFNKSVYIFTELTTNMNNIFALNLTFNIKFEDIVFLKTADEDAPIFTGQGFGISLILMTGLALKYISIKVQNATNAANIVKYGIVDKFERLENKK